MWIYSIIACMSALLQCTAANNDSYIVNTFMETDTGVSFSHMVRDKETGNLYLAATNTIYELNESLLKLRRNLIGPVVDSPSCIPAALQHGCPTKKSTSVTVKALVINKRANRLIVCMNVFQGSCRKYVLDKITELDSLESIKSVLVPNDDSSAVVFLAPGKLAGSEVLYFGTERTTYESVYDWLSISTRNPDNFQLVLSDTLAGNSRLKLIPDYKAFKIKYLYGFSSAGFSYFLVVQKKDPFNQDSPYITKLGRICQEDYKYSSYAEVPLVCSSGGNNYNHAQTAYLATPGRQLLNNLSMDTSTNKEALFVLFSKDGTSQTAMCVYPMGKIVSQFTLNIKKCFQGEGIKGPRHFAPADGCLKVSEQAFPIRDNYCGQYTYNFPIGTNRWPIESSPVITWNKLVTAIAVTATKNFTVAFVGTSDGDIKKVVVESQSSATQYSEIAINRGHKILPDMEFGENGKYLYVLTDNKVTRIKVEECEKNKGCLNCIINSPDPYCGWCTLESKCSTHGSCVNSDLQKHWLPYNNKRCTEITFVSPNMTQIKDDRQTLNINIQNLPTVTGVRYQCAFYMREGSQPLLTDGHKTDNGITCMTPPKSNLPDIPTGMDHITMRLAVRSNGQDFVATDYSFFDCSRHSSCTSCTTSKFPCTFCLRQHKCTHNREGCGSDVMITGMKVPGKSERRGPDYCPKITSSNNRIAVASGYSKIVEVKAENLLNIQQTFFCKFNKNGNPVKKDAEKIGDVIKCKRETFSYTTDAPTYLVPFDVVWESDSGENTLDNPSNIQVLIYKCSNLAESGGTPNCGNCLTLDNKYQCGWCRDSNTCTVERDCQGGKTWLTQSDICPNPQITSISPTSGPLNGGTKVTINGINLGKSRIDIRNGVTVAGVPCVDKEYVKTSRIVCETGRTGSSKSGEVSVRIAGQYLAVSRSKFSYVMPTISNFEPKMGIQAGGTSVTITGNYLDAGTDISVEFGSNSCAVKSTSETEIVCETSPVVTTQSGVIKLKFDKQEIVGHHLADFLYKPNPNITSFGRGVGFKMGGLEELITGTNFDAVQDPKLFIDYNGRRYFGTCSVFGEKVLLCMSPSLTSAVSKRSASVLESVYGMKIENLQKTSPSLLKLYPDPVIVKFPKDQLMISKKIGSLKIEGSNLSPTLTKADIRVVVGQGNCAVSLLVPASERDQKTTDEIHCDLPTPEDGVNEYTVQVIIGSNSNHTFPVGTLIYEDEEVLPLWAKIVLGVVGALMIIIIVSVIIAYKRKSRQSDKQVQQMHHQMDVLETKVAKECKEAFAELQTDMNEMTSDLTGVIGMPFLDYKSFCMRVLFPNCNEFDHPVVRELEVDYIHQDSLERGLRQFDQLMNNKTFLLLFIRTLEADKHFSMKDRVNVASLVSVALQGKMEYMTDILKTLLSDLIERSIEGKNHPKLLLRRTQSVAEKMLTNWFTFLLFKFLKECAGEPLFMLFRAIKQQVEKGPIDAVTGEAKYSLSEDKLIRQQMEYKTLTIYVIEAETYNSQQHPVKVLDADTISQVKEKILDAIYKNAPFSSRHSKDELDLEWHTGAQGRVTLQDEDRMSTKSDDGGYKRVNTLQHYGVPDNAIMSLVTKQQQYNHSGISDRSMRSREYDNSYLTSSPSMSHIRSPNSSNLDVEAGSKLYHLVKPQDSDVQKEGERGSKMVSEIYLTRLLATKGTLQQFVDDLFETLFSTAHRGSALPLAIKYLFDFLDDQALLHSITDPETVHTWKSNSLPLRFWVNVIKNPNFVFDVYKSSIVDSCLSVVAQTFMDSCSMSDHRLGKDSPATKLLYAKDIPKYKKWVERYYQDIKLMPAISDQDMNALLAEESRMHQSEFNTLAALNELYKYATKYNDHLHQTLEEDEFARKNRLSHRLEQVHMCMETEV